MKLADLNPVGFIPMVSAEAARSFYEGTLGLPFVSDDGFAMVFRLGAAGNLMLRVARVRAKDFQPTSFTIFGWETPDIEATIDELSARGVAFERFGFFEQDERGIWNAPGGGRVAWFKDPDGNTLSVSQHPS